MWQWPTMTWTATVCHQVIGPPLFLDSKWLSSLYVGVFKVGLLTSGKHVPCKRVGLVLALYPACCSNVLRLQLGYCPDVSPGVVCSCPEISAKWSRRRNLRWASIQVGQTPLQIAASRIRLKVNQRSSRQWRSVQDRVMKNNSEAVRGSIHILPTTLWRMFRNYLKPPPRGCFNDKIYHDQRKQALMLLLKFTAALIPVPLMQEATGIALKIVEVCEVSEILEKVNAIRSYLPSNKRSRSCKRGYAIWWSLSWTML